MYKIIVFLPILFSLGLVAQNQKDTVHVEKKYPNGTLMYKGDFLDNKPVGLLVRYFDTGIIKAKLNHKQDTVYAELFDERGKKTAVGRYVNKLKEGCWKYYSEGVLVAEENYCSGIKNGVEYTYFSAGNIAKETQWKKGKRNGMAKRYYPNGKLRVEMFYKNNKLNGKFTAYENTGIKKSDGYYLNDLKDGIWIYYLPNGSFSHKREYSKGIPEGTYGTKKDSLSNKAGSKTVDPGEYMNSPEEYMMEVKKRRRK